MDTKENPQQILFVFRVLTGFDCFSTFIMFLVEFLLHVYVAVELVDLSSILD